MAAAQLGRDEELVLKVKTDWQDADISPKLKTLLNIAGKVQQKGKLVTDDDVTAARAVADRSTKWMRKEITGSIG